MRLPIIITNLKSKYCKLVFLFSIVLGYFLVPKHIWYSSYIFLAIPFVLLFAFTMACTIRNIKEKVKSKKQNKGSVIGIIASILGISVLQVCGIGVPMCGVSIGMSLLSIFLPSSLLISLSPFGGWILGIIIIIQIISLYFLGCFKTEKRAK